MGKFQWFSHGDHPGRACARAGLFHATHACSGRTHRRRRLRAAPAPVHFLPALILSAISFFRLASSAILAFCASEPCGAHHAAGVSRTPRAAQTTRHSAQPATTRLGSAERIACCRPSGTRPGPHRVVVLVLVLLLALLVDDALLRLVGAVALARTRLRAKTARRRSARGFQQGRCAARDGPTRHGDGAEEAQKKAGGFCC